MFFFFMTNAYQSHIPNCKEQNDIIRKEYKLYFKNNISMLITYICVFWIGNIVSYFILKWIFNKGRFYLPKNLGFLGY